MLCVSILTRGKRYVALLSMVSELISRMYSRSADVLLKRSWHGFRLRDRFFLNHIFGILALRNASPLDNDASRSSIAFQIVSGMGQASWASGTLIGLGALHKMESTYDSMRQGCESPKRTKRTLWVCRIEASKSVEGPSWCEESACGRQNQSIKDHFMPLEKHKNVHFFRFKRSNQVFMIPRQENTSATRYKSHIAQGRSRKSSGSGTR